MHWQLANYFGWYSGGYNLWFIALSRKQPNDKSFLSSLFADETSAKLIDRHHKPSHSLDPGDHADGYFFRFLMPALV